MLNKVEDHKACLKCGLSRDMTPEEEKIYTKEEAELALIMKDWGNIEQLEEQREDMLDFISELELEATPIFICYCFEKMITILGNIINNPNEEKYKTLKMDNNVFYSNIGRFQTAIKLFKFLGFETIRMENSKLAYKYSQPTVKGVHPLMLLTYDELRMALAKNIADKLEATIGIILFILTYIDSTGKLKISEQV